MGASEEVREHSWFSPDWPTAECLAANINVPGDEPFFDWTWRTLRTVIPGPFHPRLASETDTSYFHAQDEEEEDGTVGSAEVVAAAASNGDSSVSTPTTTAVFEGSQLSFAGFTYSSPKLTPFPGFYLAPFQRPENSTSSTTLTCTVTSLANEEGMEVASVLTTRLAELGMQNRLVS